MIYILFGNDVFSRYQALKEIKSKIGPYELQDANTSVLQGSDLTLTQLASAYNAMPFLSGKRLVIVEGLLSSLEDRDHRQRRRRPRAAEAASRLSRWQGLKERLLSMPSTTELVFLEGRLSQDNPLLVELRHVSKVRPFPALSGQALRQWIRNAVLRKGGRISPAAVNSLADLIGSDLWAIGNEVEKLCLYAMGREIQDEDIKTLVSSARESNIFATIDAILERKPSLAIGLLHRLIQSGEVAPYILLMLARQVRLLVLSKEMRSRRIPSEEIGKRLGISAAYPLKKTLEQERRLTFNRLMEFHRLLLETDLSIKTGKVGEAIALDLLVTQLCSATTRLR